MLLFWAFLGRHLPTGKSVFASPYALVGWEFLFAYILVVGALWAHGGSAGFPFSIHAHRGAWRWWKRTIWGTVALCTLALGTLWLWADMVDGLFAVLFVALANLYRKHFLHRKSIHGWILFYMAGSFALLTNADKVFGYPARDPDFFYIGAYSFWAVAHCYALHLICKKHFKPWAWAAAAFIVMYFPLLELPAELTRQHVGLWLTGPIEKTYFRKIDLYYTKIRPNEVWVVTGPKYHSADSYRRESGGTYKRTEHGGGFFEKWDQYLRTPRFALWLNDRFKQQK